MVDGLRNVNFATKKTRESISNKITPAIYVIWTDPFFNTYKAELTWISCRDCNSFVCSALTDTNVLVNQAITREWPKGSQFDKTILVLIFEIAHLIKKEKTERSYLIYKTQTFILVNPIES